MSRIRGVSAMRPERHDRRLGPRFLHSTGQLHKGGPPTGWFLQFTRITRMTVRSPAGRTPSADSSMPRPMATTRRSTRTTCHPARPSRRRPRRRVGCPRARRGRRGLVI
jgi:hypothetical protein